MLGVAPDTISLQGIRLATLADNLRLFKAGHATDSIYHTAQLYIDFFLGSGGLTQKPDAGQILEPRFLN